MERDGILAAIGNTPLVALSDAPGSGRVLAKLEGANPTGSMKDRMALSMIEGAERRGELGPGGRVVEYTGGSTGSSLAMVCAAKGYEAHLISSDAFSNEKLRTMEAFGATVEVLAAEDGQVTPDLIDRMIGRAHELADEPNTFWTDQFNNADNRAGYHALGDELLAEVERIDAFVMAVGTGGAFSGVAERLRDASPDTRLVAVEPATSRNLSGGEIVGHRQQGIGVGFVPDIYRGDLTDEVVPVEDEEAFGAARRLAQEQGIFVGITSGTNLHVARQVADRLGAGATVVTLFVDTGLKYLSTDLFT
ncbi:MAG: cysteine synthase family protein [Nitriliruptorales bacterium]|nr:cysteine synthase family protein [Nitriliruptorales bacterium]